jgi:large subunit ribosomal protein L23
MAKKVIITKEVTKEGLILSPVMTEKASLQSSSNAYTFEVKDGATKLTLRDEIKAKYKVTPTKINIVSLPKTRVFVRGKIGVTTGMKKAIVFLKKGDTIKLA